MPSASTTFQFPPGPTPPAESWTEQNALSNLRFVYSVADGNPGGSAEWTQNTGASGDTQSARSDVFSWASRWGIPTDATVLDIQMTGYDELLWASAGIQTAGFGRRYKMRFLDNVGFAIVHSGSDLYDSTVQNFTADVGQVHARAGGSVINVDSAYRSASQGILFELETLLTTNSAPTVDIEEDNIVVTINYALPSPALKSFSRARFPKHMLRKAD